MSESPVPTPYAVRCAACSGGGPVYLTPAAFVAQLARRDERWTCPRCGQVAAWDAANYDLHTDPDGHPPDAEDPETRAMLDEIFGKKKPT